MTEQAVFQIDQADNVATAPQALVPPLPKKYRPGTSLRSATLRRVKTS